MIRFIKELLVISSLTCMTQASDVPSAATDFGKIQLCIQNYCVKVAIQTIKNGEPNKYIGNPGIINDLNMTPLTALCDKVHDPELIEWALKAGADPNKHGYWKKTETIWRYPLEFALSYGDITISNLLISYGANIRLINLEQTLRETLSNFHCYKGHLVHDAHNPIECIKLLLEGGADPRKKPLYPNGSVGKESALDFIKSQYAQEIQGKDDRDTHWKKDCEEIKIIMDLFNAGKISNIFLWGIEKFEK